MDYEFSDHQLYTKVYVTLFDGVCDRTKELQTLSGSMSNNVTWTISSFGRFMFVRFSYGSFYSAPGFLAKIQYGNVLNKKLHAVVDFRSLGLKMTQIINHNLGFKIVHNPGYDFDQGYKNKSHITQVLNPLAV